MRDKNSILIISIIWFFFCLIYNSMFNDYTQVNHNFLVICCIISYAMCLINWYLAGCRMTSIYVVFIVYAFFSNLGQSLLSLFPNTELLLIIYNMYNYIDICNMLGFQLLCISGLNLGTVLFVYKTKNVVKTSQLQFVYQNNDRINSQRLLDLFLIISFTVMLFIAVRQLLLRQTMSYSEMYDQQIYGGFYRFGTIAFGIISVLRKRHVKLLFWGWLFLFLVFMITGTRSVAIPYFGILLIMTPIVYPVIVQNKFLPIWFLGGFLGFAFISILSSMRQSAFGRNSFETNWWFSFLGTIQEMGSSARPVIATMNETQNIEQLYFTIPYSILQIFIPSSILDSILPSNWLINPSKWINTTHSSNNAWGFSFIAEAYLNFRYWGCVFMIIYGYLIALLENKAYKQIINGHYLFAACFLAILSRQIFFARGNMQLSIDFFRPTFYIFIIWYLFLKNKIKSFK